MVDTAGTLTKAADLMMERGALSVRAICTHPLLSGDAYDKIEKSKLEELIVTDSIPLRQKSKNIKVLAAPIYLLTLCITCIITSRSVQSSSCKFNLKTIMKSITINGSKRESVGKVATKALRNAG